MVAEWSIGDPEETCYKCRQLKALKNRQPECEACKDKRPVLMEANLEAVSLAYKYRNYIHRDGGFDLLALERCFDYEGVPVERRALLIRKIDLYLSIIINKAYRT